MTRILKYVVWVIIVLKGWWLIVIGLRNLSWAILQSGPRGGRRITLFVIVFIMNFLRIGDMQKKR
jgi:hypothetical protein